MGSWVIEPNSDTPHFRTYIASLNPPILHRKELLVAPSHPKRDEWQALTKVAEDLGLFENVRVIGFRKNWQQLIEEKGFTLSSTGFAPIGNAEEIDATKAESKSDVIYRPLLLKCKSVYNSFLPPLLSECGQ